MAQDDRFAYTVRVGIHQANTFMRISFSGGKPEEVRAFRTLTDAFAKPAANASLYVESQGGEETSCDGFTDIPCRIVLAPALPFGGVQRTLTPQLTVAYQGQPRTGQPLPFSGTLTQQVVSGNSVVSTTAAGRRLGRPVPPHRLEPRALRRHRPEGRHAAPTAATRSCCRPRPATPGTPPRRRRPVPTWAGRGTVGSVAP